ncbi:uncharacterized protein LOC129939935 [Eupeodes corollae]|uniref:uncharacterized protein LOC129939935 n=1 Tax=Eupeodes corollae TaxID=290404 RepID=UPI0024901644|nr:uncharacterized protein LOC129939935 [Eupeodes corollae]
MSDKISFSNFDNSESLYSILKDCVNGRSIDSLTDDSECSASVQEYSTFDCYRMVSMTDSFGDDILEENGRISLAYENLRSIPKRIAEKFSSKTKFLDLGNNDFTNLSFLMFFDRLHTLILDRNTRLDVNTLPFLPNLRILWINNCNITNIDIWLYRIQDQCPNIQQLSIMGNPATMKLLYEQPNNDYRDYVFNKIPSLKYLDGIANEPLSRSLLRIPSKSSTVTSDSTRTNLSYLGLSRNGKLSLSSFKLSELFKFKRRRRWFQNSTTST